MAGTDPIVDHRAQCLGSMAAAGAQEEFVILPARSISRPRPDETTGRTVVLTVVLAVLAAGWIVGWHVLLGDIQSQPADVVVDLAPVGLFAAVGAAVALHWDRRQQQAAASLRESERDLRAVFEGSGVGIALVDPRGPLLRVNPALATFTGYSRDALLATDFQALTFPEDLPGELDQIACLVAGELDRFERDKRYVRADGSLVWARLTVTAIRDEGGSAAYVVGMVQDISAAKDAQAQRERLASAEKMEAVGLLAGGIAHDFNNLLAAIRGFSELHLDTHAPEDPTREDIVEICRTADRAAELVRQLLAFGRRQTAQAEPLELAEVVASSLPLVERLLGDGIRVVVRAAADTPTVVADRVQLEQVLLNLAANARDAMPRGGLLRIETAPADLDRAFVGGHPGTTPGLHALLVLSDTGSGMDEEARGRAFEPFFTTKEKGRGTGLGLASVHGIVKEAGGTIEVESLPGAGATFRIYLPAMSRQPEDYQGL